MATLLPSSPPPGYTRAYSDYSDPIQSDPAEKHINKNILIEPMMSTLSNGSISSYLQHPTPLRSRTPSPSVSDGDSGYSSKQMSPVSLVSDYLIHNNVFLCIKQKTFY